MCCTIGLAKTNVLTPIPVSIIFLIMGKCRLVTSGASNDLWRQLGKQWPILLELSTTVLYHISTQKRLRQSKYNRRQWKIFCHFKHRWLTMGRSPVWPDLGHRYQKSADLTMPYSESFITFSCEGLFCSWVTWLSAEKLIRWSPDIPAALRAAVFFAILEEGGAFGARPPPSRARVKEDGDQPPPPPPTRRSWSALCSRSASRCGNGCRTCDERGWPAANNLAHQSGDGAVSGRAAPGPSGRAGTVALSILGSVDWRPERAAGHAGQLNTVRRRGPAHQLRQCSSTVGLCTCTSPGHRLSARLGSGDAGRAGRVGVRTDLRLVWADGGRGSGRSAPLAVPDAASAGAVWADAGSGAGGGRQRPEACSGTNYSEIIFHDACAVRIIACRSDVFPQVWRQWNNILSESDASDFRDFGRFVTQSGADRARVCRVKPVCCVVRVTDCDCHREGCVWNMTTIARFLCCVLSLARVIWMVHELSEHICCMAAVAGGKCHTRTINQSL